MDNEQLSSLIRDVPDFPKPGISYKDITTLLKEPSALKAALSAMVNPFLNDKVELVVGIESRGFILGAPIAIELGCGFIPMRKPGKLPAETLSQEYDLEYGSDVLATGGTLAASCQLLDKLEAEIVGISVLAELSFLQGRKKLPDCRFEAVIEY